MKRATAARRRTQMSDHARNRGLIAIAAVGLALAIAAVFVAVATASHPLSEATAVAAFRAELEERGATIDRGPRCRRQSTWHFRCRAFASFEDIHGVCVRGSVKAVGKDHHTIRVSDLSQCPTTYRIPSAAATEFLTGREARAQIRQWTRLDAADLGAYVTYRDIYGCGGVRRHVVECAVEADYADDFGGFWACGGGLRVREYSSSFVVGPVPGRGAYRCF
jgi:hypothetical protein